MLSTKRTKQLEPRVTVAARVLAVRQGMDASEAEQEIWLGICERAHRDKTFLKQTDCYVVQGGVYAARNEWQKYRRRQERQLPEEQGSHITSDSRLPENLCSGEYLKALMRRLRGDRVAKATARGLVAGYKKREIAQKAGVSPQAVSAAVKRLEVAMETMGGRDAPQDSPAN